MKDLEYWQKYLSGANFSLEFPKTFSQENQRKGEVYNALLDPKLSKRLTGFVEKEKTTMFRLLMAAFAVLLHRYTGREDFIIGYPVDLRPSGLETKLGIFINNLPMRFQFNKKSTFIDALNQATASRRGAKPFQDCPYDQIVKAMGSVVTHLRQPLFNVSFVLENFSAKDFDLKGIQSHEIYLDAGTAKFDLSLIAFEEELGIRLSFEYPLYLFTKKFIQELAGNFQVLLNDLVTHPNKAINDLHLLSNEKQVLKMGLGTKTKYPREKGVAELFEEIVEKHGLSMALSSREGAMNYAELNAKANKLARHLQKMGVKKGDFVGISLDRSTKLIIGILAIIKAGGVYVPIDQSYPMERKHLMIEDANISLLLTQRDFVKQFPKLKLVCLDVESFDSFDSQNLGVTSQPLDLIYINYTSGSTGKPKGVEICQRGVVRLVRNTDWIEISPKDRFLQMSNISFDATTFEIWGALLNGATLCIFPQGDFSPVELGKFLIQEKVSHLWLTARLFTVMVEEQLDALKGLRYLLAGGDVFPVKHAKIAFQALPDCQLVNGYGPTENTTFTTTYSIRDLKFIENGVPIGRPISNTNVYILDKNRHLVPIGVAGELYAGGDGRALGYLNQKGLTKEKFVPNPFGKGLLYRTGDLVSFLPDGNILFQGRIDTQVKIRGFRIELGEIEEVLRHHPKIADCVALAREDSPGDKRLVAYVEPKVKKTVSSDELQKYAASIMPAYMVPSFFVILKKFPLSPTGKVDRKALPAPVIGTKEKAVFNTPMEKAIAAIWAHVLHLDHVARHDNFFKLGGDSINAMQMISRLKKDLQIDASVEMLFQYPVMIDFASHIESQKKHGLRARIPKRKIHSPVPISMNEESMWLLDELYPESTAYTVSFAFRMHGNINCSLLERALEEILRRHEALRTHFFEKDGFAFEYIEEKAKESFFFSDLTSEPDAEAKGMALLEKKAATPFDLKKTPLIQFHMMKVDTNEFLGLLHVHHIVFDGWSSEMFFKEWALNYSSLLNGKVIERPELEIQAGDYAVWQREFLKSEEAKKQLAYWKKKLDSALAFLELPADKPRPPEFTRKGGVEVLELSEEFSALLRNKAKGLGSTLFVFLMTAFKVLLYRYSGKEDIVIGTPFANRKTHELEPLIAFIAQILTVRSDLSGSPTFSALLRQVSTTMSEAYSHSDIPIATLVGELNPPRSLSYHPIFQVGFALEVVVQRMIQLENVEVTPIPLENKPIGIVDLYFAIREEGKKLKCCLEYYPDIFEAKTIQRMLKNFQTLLSSILENPDQKIDQLAILTPQELHQMTIEWNKTTTSYPKDQTICPLFEDIVEKYPENIALRSKGKAMTYRELNSKANKLARHLKKLGVKKQDFVGLYLDRSIDLNIGILAILKAGGVYVPIDASYPMERKLFMIEDTSLKILLTQSNFAKQFPQDKIHLICLDTDQKNFSSYEDSNLKIKVDPLDLAYINYTSGSTGRPKGVQVTHRGVVRLVRNINWDTISTKDRFLQMSNISFDAFTHEMWGALLNGASVCVFPQVDLSPEVLGDFIVQEKVTQILFTARLFTLMVEEKLDCLKGVRCLCSCGDVMSSRHAKRAFEVLTSTQVKNTCGHTENTTHTVTYDILDAESIENGVPIGRPISNTTIYILDKNLQPVPVGVYGELYTGGDGVARGYLNRDELTKEKFIPNPFGAGTLYRTGDLVRYLPDGNVAYISRIDNQVKIRGFRIELGEVEEILRNFKKVADCIALAREDTPGDKRLVAYIEPKVDMKLTVEELREYISSKLPQYMVPSFFIILKKFPVTPNGKVDRKALPAPEVAKRKKGKISFKTETEKTLASIWSQVLHIGGVASDDHFFRIGGDSIHAMQLVTQIKKIFQVEVAIHIIFQNPILSDLASWIDSQNACIVQEVIPKRKTHSPIPLSLNQESLWLIEKLYPQSALYMIPFAFQMEGKIDMKKLKGSLEKILQRHEILRTRFIEEKGNSLQSIGKQCPDAFVEVQMSEKEGLEFIRKKTTEGMDLTKLPLLQVHMIKVRPDLYLGLLRAHHIIFDGWSVGVFLNEWTATDPMPDLPIQYGDFAIWQREYLQTEAAKKQLDYWKKQLYGAPELLELPWDKPRPTQFSGKGDAETLGLSEELTQRLNDLAKKEGVTLYVLLMTAFIVFLYRYSGKEDIVIGTPFANRGRHELEPLIGFFVQMFAIRSKIAGNFSECVQNVNRAMHDAFQNADIPFEKIVAELNPTRNPSYNPIFQVGFGLENVTDIKVGIEGVKVKEIPLEFKISKFDMNLTAKEVGKKLRCYLEYSTDLFEKETIQSMLKHFQTLLEGVNRNEKVSLLPILTEQELQQITVEWNDTTTAYPRDDSIPSLFEKIVEQYPDHPALRFLNKEMTYRELNEKANKLAHHLQKEGVKKGDFVGITLDRSFELVIGFLAILKTGAVYVPIDAAYPADRREFMIEDTGLRVHVTKEMFADAKTDSTKNLGVEISPLDLAYINYTSGSTGRPKGVEIMHRGVIRHIKNSGYFECTPQDRVLNMASISFDATTTEVWGALLNGACLCVSPQKEFSIEELGKFLVDEKITHGLFTARLFNLLVEQQLSSLKHMKYMVSVGEAMSVYHAKVAFEALSSCQLINGYGPTENTACTTFYVIHDLNEIEHVVPIGRPICNTQVYLLDANKQPVPIGVHGEIYTGGDGVARGYLNRPDLTAEKFVPNPFGQGKLYRTGDLAKFLPDGNIVYLGRIDSQVKIRGFRIELGEIEEVLRQHEKVADCIALAREDVPGEKQLVAYVEPKTKEKLTQADLNEYAASKLPKYMVPSFFIVLDKFPITPNGKIDRKALPSPLQTMETRAFDPPKTATEQVIADTWAALLKIPKVGRKDHFFHLGGHSIAAAQLSSLVSTEFGIQVPVGLIFEDSILEKYAKKIDQLTMQTEGKQAVTTRELFWIWRNRESVLDSSIQPEGPPPEAYQYEKPKKIFLTGVTGFVGAFFLRDLIEKTDAKIYCHVRARTEKEGLSRLKEALEKYLIWDAKSASRIVVVPGDLEKNLLGMSPKEFDTLATEIDSIFHIGAFVNHALPYQKLKAANVLGTQEALRLACKTRIKPFHFISTAAVVGIESKDPIPEDIDLRDCKNLFNGYAQSKWVGEKLVMTARSRGLPASIYRLARVSGDSRVGSGPTGDYLWRVVQASLRLQMAPTIDYSEEVTPVDFICEALRVISTKPEEINKQFHLLNPQSYYYKDVFKLLKHLGYPLKMTDFETWRQSLVKTAIDTGEEELRALMPLFSEIDLSQGGEPVTFAYDHVTEALKGTGVKCPKVDEKLFKKYIDYYVKIGFLPPYG